MYIQLSASTQKRWETARLEVARFRKRTADAQQPAVKKRVPSGTIGAGF